MKTTDMKSLIDRRLSSLRFQREEAVMQGLAQPPESKAPRRLWLVPAFALALALLLAGVALALSLRLSSQMHVRQQAVDALGQAYGLNEETISLFDVRVEKHGKGWLIQLTPKNHYPGKVGEYQVAIEEGAAPAARWSLQGSPDYAPEKGQLSPVWGHDQLLSYKRAVQDAHDRMAQVDWRQADRWTLEERAQIDQLTLPETPYEDRVYGHDRHVVPGAEDLQPQDAWHRAEVALADRYGLPLRYIRGLKRGEQAFLQSAQDGSRWYTMTFDTPDSQPGQGQSFFIRLASPGGTVLKAHWFLEDASKRTLPAGDLAGYREAVEEYMQTDAFARLSAKDKADLALRMNRAGMGALLEGVVYVTPTDAHLPEAQALQKAERALEAAYGLKGRSLRLFDSSFSLERVAGEAQWVLRLSPRPLEHWRGSPASPLGTYAVRLDGATGVVKNTQWSLQGVEKQTYTQATFGQARAYAGYMLPWLEQLMEKADALRQTAQDEHFMNVQEAAQYDQLFRDAGFPLKDYLSGLPRGDDIQEEQAVALALEALESIYGLKGWEGKDFDFIWPSYMLRTGYHPFDSERPFWIISFHGGGGIYVVALDAKTGEILYVNYDPAASANG